MKPADLVSTNGTPEEHQRARALIDWLLKEWESEPHRHVWWTEQQTGHKRCAYCDAHP